MRKPLVPALLLAATAVAEPAEPEAILRCEAVGGGAHVTFDLTSKGLARMTLVVGGELVTCPLRVISLHDRPKAIKPEVSLDVSLAAAECKPALPDSIELLEQIALRFDLRGERTLPIGRAQWRKGQQVGECAVSAWDHAAIEVMADARNKR